MYSKHKAKRNIFYSYSRYINGFAAILDEEDALKIKSEISNNTLKNLEF